MRLISNFPLVVWALTTACSSAGQQPASGAGDQSSANQDASQADVRRRDAGGAGGVSAGAGSSGNAAGTSDATNGGGMTSSGGAPNSGGRGNAGASGAGGTRGSSTAGASGSTGTSAGNTSSGGSGGAAGRGASTGGKGGSSGTGGQSTGRAGSGSSSGGASNGGGSSSSGCGKSGMQTGDFHLQTTDGNGTSRDYEVMVPSSYSPRIPLALSFVYHGYGGSEDESKAYGLEGAQGAQANSIFVFPQGIDFNGKGVGWDDSCSGRDVAFFDNMRQTLEANYCIDASKVFVAGFSWGCDHVTALTCCRGSSIRATAGASCTDDFKNSSDYRTYANSPCPSSTNVAIRFTYDPAGDKGYSAQQFASTVSLYRSWNGCGTSSVAAGGTCVSYQGCAQPVLDCPSQGLGHMLPPNWGTDTWTFFSGL